MLIRSFRSSHIMLVGMQNGTAISEDTCKFLQKKAYSYHMIPQSYSGTIYSQELKTSVHTKICTQMFIDCFPDNCLNFSSVKLQSCPTLCDPINHSTPGLPVHHQLPELTQTHVHRVSDAIQPSLRLSSPSPPAPNPSQHQSLFQ